MFHVSEAGHATLCGVVGCFRGEKPPLREVGPPEQSQRDLRRPGTQPRPSATLKKKIKSVANPVFHTSLPPKPLKHTTSRRSSIAVSPSLLPACGLGAAPARPRDPNSDGLLLIAGAAKTLPVAGALREGRLPSRASLVANGCCLTFVRYSNFVIQHAIAR